MADQLPGEGSSGGNTISGESSDTNLELNVKTLDSRIFHFQVDKNVSRNEPFITSTFLKGQCCKSYLFILRFERYKICF